MQEIKVAIAGFGYSGRVFHAPFLKADKRFQVVKVFERSSQNALEHLEGVEIVRSFEQLLTPEVDLVIITTPNQTHFDLTKQAILAGKHVLVEKPLAITKAQAEELAELAKAQNVILSVYQNRRFDDAVVAAKEILAQGLIGEAVDCEIRFERYAKGKNVKAWKETGEQGTGLVYDLGVHLLDQAVYLFGKPAKIFADIRYQHEGAISDDNFSIDLWYESGLKVRLAASKYAREPSPHFVLHGKLGSYVKQAVDGQEALLSQGIQPVGDWNQAIREGILHTEQENQVIRQSFAGPLRSCQAVYDNLYEAIAEHKPLAITTEQAAYVLGLIEKAFESAKSRKILDL
ncbi:oxidoreductase [Pasteurellaceae bacterium RH1A]|nr:oxidoreductase [Pasteurellaceae bacterium RH1A]